MREGDRERSGCRAMELRVLLCCDLFGAAETLRLLGYARAIRESCAALAGGAKGGKSC